MLIKSVPNIHAIKIAQCKSFSKSIPKHIYQNHPYKFTNTQNINIKFHPTDSVPSLMKLISEEHIDGFKYSYFMFLNKLTKQDNTYKNCLENKLSNKFEEMLENMHTNGYNLEVANNNSYNLELTPLSTKFIVAPSISRRSDLQTRNIRQSPVSWYVPENAENTAQVATIIQIYMKVHTNLKLNLINIETNEGLFEEKIYKEYNAPEIHYVQFEGYMRRCEIKTPKVFPIMRGYFACAYSILKAMRYDDLAVTDWKITDFDNILNKNPFI